MLTEKDIAMHTYTSRWAAKRSCKNVHDYESDSSRDKRQERCECKTCFYLRSGMVAGQAFTDWNCVHCGREYKHPNTATPKVCADCAKELHVCRRCCATTDDGDEDKK